MIGVVAEARPYRVAVAELPVSARLSDDPAGAVAVVPGDGRWCDRVRAAADAGAAGVVVSRPAPADVESIETLTADLGSLPVVVERAFLRHDTIDDARALRRADGRPSAVITVDAVAPASSFELVLRDAVGWLRVLSDERTELSAVGDGLALFDPLGADGVPAALTAVRVASGAPRIHALALGEERWEVEASDARGCVSTTNSLGRTMAPRRYESHARLALRTALEAVQGGVSTNDLADLAGDTAVALRIVLGVRQF